MGACGMHWLNNGSLVAQPAPWAVWCDCLLAHPHWQQGSCTATTDLLITSWRLSQGQIPSCQRPWIRQRCRPCPDHWCSLRQWLTAYIEARAPAAGSALLALCWLGFGSCNRNARICETWALQPLRRLCWLASPFACHVFIFKVRPCWRSRWLSLRSPTTKAWMLRAHLAGTGAAPGPSPSHAEGPTGQQGTARAAEAAAAGTMRAPLSLLPPLARVTKATPRR
jgi:hypothetical protein